MIDAASRRNHAPLAVAAFRRWVASRPDEERWELVDGTPMMMAPPTRDHQRIASNLERLLNDAVERLPQPPTVAAYQRIGVNLGAGAENDDPEADVAVVEVATGSDPRYADRIFLAAEVVSRSDLATVEGKVDLDQRHPDCSCVLVIRQDRCEVDVHLRDPGGSRRVTLSAMHDRLTLPAFGLTCELADLYKGTVGLP